MALLVLVSVSPSLVEAEEPPAHKDPRTVRAGINAIALIDYFGMVAGVLARGNYAEASEQLKAIEHANISRDLRFIVDRYVALLNSLGEELNATRVSLSKASALMSQAAQLHQGLVPDNERAVVRKQLESAETHMLQAQVILADLHNSTSGLARRLAIFAVAGDTPLRNAYDKLQDLLMSLDDLWAQYDESMRKMSEALEVPVLEVPEVPLVVEVALHETTLQFDSPSRGYPGRTIRVVGQVATVDGPEPLEVLLYVLLDKNIMTSFMTSGTFNHDLQLPKDILLGQHTLTIKLLSQGLYEGVSASRNIAIIRADSHLQVQFPTFIFLQRSVGVSGEVTSDFGPVKHATVTLELEERETTVQTDEHGRFSDSVPLSLGQFLFGPGTLMIDVQPVEPWQSSVTEQATLFIINFTALGILSMAMTYGLFLVSKAWRGRPQGLFAAPARGSADLVPDTLVTPLIPSSLPLATRIHVAPDSARGRVVLAYHRAAGILESKLGVYFQGNYTLRDFLANIGPRASIAFNELTGITERVLYDVYAADDHEVRHAEELARVTESEVT